MPGRQRWQAVAIRQMSGGLHAKKAGSAIHQGAIPSVPARAVARSGQGTRESRLAHHEYLGRDDCGCEGLGNTAILRGRATPSHTLTVGSTHQHSPVAQYRQRSSLAVSYYVVLSWANMGQAALATVATLAGVATCSLQLAQTKNAPIVRIPPLRQSPNQQLCGARLALPRVGAAFDHADAGDSSSFQEERRTGAGGFIRSIAKQNDLAILWNFAASRREFLAR
jgi:hypothetical protein